MGPPQWENRSYPSYPSYLSRAITFIAQNLSWRTRPMDGNTQVMDSSRYDDAYVKALFDRMGRTYDVMNVVSSFGFSEFWRWQCVANVPIQKGQQVCDMMAGTGECWRYLRWRGAAMVTAVDFSHYMAERQRARRVKTKAGAGDSMDVAVLEENATATSLADASMDHVVCAFGLKTLNPAALEGFAREIHRILKPGGHFSLLEISLPESWIMGRLYQWYISVGIPFIGKVWLGDIDCYRMLGEYTQAFGSCESVVGVFREAGLEAEVKRHFFGCATSLMGRKV